MGVYFFAASLLGLVVWRFSVPENFCGERRNKGVQGSAGCEVVVSRALTGYGDGRHVTLVCG